MPERVYHAFCVAVRVTRLGGTEQRVDASRACTWLMYANAPIIGQVFRGMSNTKTYWWICNFESFRAEGRWNDIHEKNGSAPEICSKVVCKCAATSRVAFVRMCDSYRKRYLDMVTIFVGILRIARLTRNYYRSNNAWFRWNETQFQARWNWWIDCQVVKRYYLPLDEYII